MVKTNITYQNEVASIKVIRQKAIDILNELTTPQGIYASNDGLWNGRFHHYFGRDTAITALLIFEAEAISKDYKFTPIALQALSSIAAYQGQKNNPETGEEFGKIPHEVITSQKDIDILQTTIKNGGSKPWFVDSDGILKNWDSADSTALWIIAVSSALKHGWEMSDDIAIQLTKAAKWCISNLENFNGFNGWLPAELQPNRQYGGLTNQAWKDSWPAFLQEDGRLPNYPLHDIFSSAAVWSALSSSAELLANIDSEVSNKAMQTAKSLKARFNETEKGFKLEGEDFYAEALDANLNQLAAHTVDVGMSMALMHNQQNIYDDNLHHKLVSELMGDKFFTEDFGLRTYQKDLTNFVQNDQYHRGPNTYWPFASALTALGFAKSGFYDESVNVLKSMMNGLGNFDSFVELFLVKDGQAEVWKHAESEQTSTLNQAWTAAAAYYGSIFLENS